ALVTACSASDNWSVSSTPLLSASFTSGDVTEVILSSLVCKSVLPAVPFGTISTLFFANCFAASNPLINASTSYFSTSVTNLSYVTSTKLIYTNVFVCYALSTDCAASDNCSVSMTPLLSYLFTAREITVVILTILVLISFFPLVQYG